MRYAVKSAPPPGGAPNTFVMSDGSIDRMGDVIEPKGWVLEHFKSHPVALFNHDSDQVIGKWTDVRVEGGQLRGQLELAEAGTSPLVDTVRALVRQNILRAVSVGFRPVEKKPLNDDAYNSGKAKNIVPPAASSHTSLPSHTGPMARSAWLRSVSVFATSRYTTPTPISKPSSTT